MSVESESAKRYHGKEGLLFLSSLALLLSPFIKIGGPITVKIKEFLEIPVEVSDALPAIAFFYLSTLALAFYVFVEWRRLETSERKTIQNWSFAAFETIAVLALYWRYSDLLKNTPYGKFSPLWFAPFLIVGFLFGMAFSMFRFAFSLMRTREEAKRKNLPRIPRQAKEMIAGNCLMILLILLPATIAAFYFYPGPTRWVPSVLLLLAVVPGLPAFDFAKVDHSDGTRPLDKLKAVTDWSDHMERAAVLFDRDSSAKEFAESLLHSSAEDIQQSISEQVKLEAEKKLVKCRTSYEGKLPNTDPPILVFRRETGSGVKTFHVKESVAKKWLGTAFEALSLQKQGTNPLSEKAFKKKLDDIGWKWCNLLVDDILYRDGGSSLLMERIKQKKADDLEWIILADPNVNDQIGGCTPLLQATADGFILGMQLLIKHGANLEVSNNCGMTPFLFAAKYNNWECLKLLKDAGANIFAVNALGENALMMAARMGARKTAATLLRWGIDPSSQNLQKQTALDFAEASKSGDIATLIRRKMMGLSTNSPKVKGHKKRAH